MIKIILFYFLKVCYLEWVECKALGWPYSLAHEAIMVANVIQHFFSIKVVDTDGMLRRCAGGGRRREEKKGGDCVKSCRS